MTPIPLDLSSLSVEDASALEQIFGHAISKLYSIRSEARGRLMAADPNSTWAAHATAERDRADELLTQARDLALRARAQTMKADRERSVAIRAVEEMARKVA